MRALEFLETCFAHYFDDYQLCKNNSQVFLTCGFYFCRNTIILKIYLKIKTIYHKEERLICV